MVDGIDGNKVFHFYFIRLISINLRWFLSLQLSVVVGIRYKMVYKMIEQSFHVP